MSSNPKCQTLVRTPLPGAKLKKVKTTITGTQEDNKAIKVGASIARNEPAGIGAEHTGISYEFKIPGRHTIKAGLKRTRVPIAKRSLNYKERLELHPKQYPHVYRRGRLKNKFPWVLAGGPLNVYYNGAFVQQTWLPQVNRGQEFSINAGIEHNLRVHHWQRNKEADAKFLGSDKHFKREIHTKIRSFHSKRRKVRVFTQGSTLRE